MSNAHVPMIALSDDRLALEPLLGAHAPEMFALLSEPDLYRYLDTKPPESVAHLRTTYERLEARRSPDGTQHWLNWVVRNGEGHVVGYVQATVAAPDAWVAYVLGRTYWGHGYATAATRLMMQHLGPVLGVRRFLATVDRRNARSLAVLGRLGFVPAIDSAARSVDRRAHERLFVAEVGA